ncbi:TetR family transcriptional regulator [Streptomyces sp. AC563]|uniref:TetR family transcriptional regulator n=1 Tax=Streptomyces buecherae TaxID=2763006 RepID=UPI00164E46B6|nr:TetR family transcriptional regulator [Streptomyces buecherae]MBC3991989.1 TetR family transcriptional regulator [Streptomyces buecherae]
MAEASQRREGENVVEVPGRREQHKAATRRALQEAASRMFAERGYAETTVRDIAAAAGVTERTFFRYFPSKEDLVLGEILDLIPAFQGLVRARPAGEPPRTAVMNAALELAADRRGRLGVLFSGPPQRFAGQPARPSRPVLGQFEDALADTLAERLSANVADPDLALRASVLARAFAGALRAALIAYSALPDADRNLTAGADLVRAAFGMLREA